MCVYVCGGLQLIWFFWIGATWQLILNAAFMPGAAKDGAAEGGERGLKCAFTLHL